MRYYDIKRHWTRRIEPHLADERLNAVLVRDFNRFTFGRWKQRFTRGMYPRQFESGDIVDVKAGIPGAPDPPVRVVYRLGP